MQSLNIAISALEKQLPKKPNYVQYDGSPKIGNYHCPACEKILDLEPIDHNEKVFCLHCGQAIDWSGVQNEVGSQCDDLEQITHFFQD